MKKFFRYLFLALLFVVMPNAFATTYIDLTHPFTANTLYWPTARPFTLQKLFAGIAPRGYFYSINEFAMAEHVGTHMDAPYHFAKNGEKVGDVPLENLIGPAVVINVSNKTLQNPDYSITIADLKNWEKQYERIPDKTIVLLYTGFSQYWPDREKYMGTKLTDTDGLAKLHFPGLSTEAANWLITERHVKAIGIDTASIDYGQSKLFKTHQILAKNNIPFFENVANLNRLPNTHFIVYALPMKIKEGTGAPLRIIAVLGSQ